MQEQRRPHVVALAFVTFLLIILGNTLIPLPAYLARTENSTASLRVYLPLVSRPREQQLAFVAYAPGEANQVYRVAPNGTGLQAVTRTGVRFHRIAWSPGGTQIAYQPIENGPLPPGTISISNDTGTQTYDLFTGLTFIKDLTWSPDGSRIAFIGQPSPTTNSVYLINPDGSGLTALNVSDSLAYSDPAFSPDGRRLAFVAGPLDVTSQDIFVINVDGSGLRQLTAGSGSNFAPAWSPDGSRIAFTSSREAGSVQVFTMGNDGSRQTRIATGVDNSSFPSWSPDGRRIAFEGRIGFDTRVYTVNPDGTDQTLLPPLFGMKPVWSPDGNWIAYLTGEVWAMRSDGTQSQMLSGNLVEPGYLVWSKP